MTFKQSNEGMYMLRTFFTSTRPCLRRLFERKGLRLGSVNEYTKWMVGYIWCREFGKLILTSYPCHLCKQHVIQRRETLFRQLEMLDQAALMKLGSAQTNGKFCVQLQQIENDHSFNIGESRK